MKKLFFFLLTSAFLLFTSCKDNNEDDIICCANYDLEINIVPKNQDGENLIETEAVTIENIALFYEIDGEWKASDNYNIISLSEKQDFLMIAVNNEIDQNNRSETKLIINGEESLITSEFNTKNGAVIIKIWLNNQVVFDASSNQGAKSIEILL
ncbi:hypothetical protein [Zunongwangia sp. HGR-M22]|uniref:hypothetical protein n=1 Tax=Zunongwangia sp. HGR-M22 TaxID=3015168 RepID=UPI0022DD8588|nr:hypothetical protein [Zunongwangia sp. HGR-M22]WBL25791.1 hypothetical protein PBT91_00515 [Zunongwangia sp. HGR-M22]